jgi:hypothetical protein
MSETTTAPEVANLRDSRKEFGTRQESTGQESSREASREAGGEVDQHVDQDPLAAR